METHCGRSVVAIVLGAGPSNPCPHDAVLRSRRSRCKQAAGLALTGELGPERQERTHQHGTGKPV